MLGRVANGIFWMYRYLERAENTARLLTAGHRMSLTRGPDAASEEWRSILTTLGMVSAYDGVFTDYSGMQVCEFVLRHKANPESVLAMVQRARTNARLCRSAITAEVWESVNEGWLSLQELLARPLREGNLGTVLANIRRTSTLTRGATHGSMLRNEIYSFARVGMFLERADNTARILDVKYYLLLPSVSYVGTALDAGQWDNVLQSLSAERAYSWLNAGRMNPRSIADFLILDDRFPRSLAFCYSSIEDHLAALARLHGRVGPVDALIGKASAHLRENTVEDVFEQGLHEFLVDFIQANQEIADCLAVQYRFVA